MNALFDLLWQFNLQLSLLLSAILILRWALRKTVKIYNVYWLWIALPLVPLISLMVSRIPQQHWLIQNIRSLFEHSSNTHTVSGNGFNQTLADNFTQSVIAAPLYNANEPTSPSSTFIAAVVAAWLIGALIFITRLFKQHFKLRQQLASPEFNVAIDVSCSGMSAINFRSRYPVRGVSKPDFSPAVYGFFRPRIFFPIKLLTQLSSQQLELIIQHEEQHVRQGHLWFNLVWDVLACLAWLNPLVYLARFSFRHDQELFCDSLVLKNSAQPQHKAYGHALISTVSATHSVSLLCSWNMFDQLEERIMNIKTQHPLFKKLLLVAGLFGLLTCGAIHAITTAHETDASEQEAKKGKSINIIKIDTDAKKQITIKTNGKTYRQEDGERFIVENGERRALNEEEAKRFAELLEKSKRYDLASGKEKRDIFEFENVHAFTFDHDGEFDLEKLDETLAALKPMEPLGPEAIEVITMIEDIELDPVVVTDIEIEGALKQARKSERAAVRKARKKLLETQRKLAAIEEEAERQRKQAIKQAKKLRELASQG